ncbi:carbohydrate ABC transporter permease [Chthonobacter albigriseus]|uniref:carbohydrate ABC transporter permease n=1 Tax=Chthonobacter albigriseus TaxID=1683161 RepID=UPI0019D59CE8|nr:sugar ABC transporter permease [Chthonobacter albigriseus]
MSFRKSDNASAWSMLAPAFLLIGLFIVVPFALSVIFAFTDQRLVPNPNITTKFVGVRNFERLFDGDTFSNAFLRTATFVILVVPLQCAMGLGAAMLINTTLPVRNVFRGIYFLPTVISMVVVSVVWASLFQMEGFFNAALRAASFGLLEPVDWLANPWTAMPSLVLMSAWQGFPFQMVVYLAGLQGISKDLYEAARIDGATRWQEFRHITIPALRNTHILVVMTTTILAFKLFTQVQLLTQGGPRGVTDTLVRYIYMTGFREGKVGLAAAAAVLFFLLVFAISLVQRRLLKEERAIQ